MCVCVWVWVSVCLWVSGGTKCHCQLVYPEFSFLISSSCSSQSCLCYTSSFRLLRPRIVLPFESEDFCWQTPVARGKSDMYGWAHGQTGIFDIYGQRKDKRDISAACQQFWWVNGKADTAVGIRGLPSAYLSVTGFPSNSLVCTICLFPVKLSSSHQGQKGMDARNRRDVALYRPSTENSAYQIKVI